MLYHQGDGVTRDMDKARGLFRQCAEGGNARCMTLYASMLEEGEGGPSDPAEALAWYMVASMAGDDDATPFLDDLRSRITAEQAAQGKVRATAIIRSLTASPAADEASRQSSGQTAGQASGHASGQTPESTSARTSAPVPSALPGEAAGKRPTVLP